MVNACSSKEVISKLKAVNGKPSAEILTEIRFHWKQKATMIPSHTLKISLRNKGITTGVHLNWTGFWMCSEYQGSGGTGWKSYTTENKHTHKRALTKLHHKLGQSCIVILCFQQRAEVQPCWVGYTVKENHRKFGSSVLPFHLTLAQFLCLILETTKPPS